MGPERNDARKIKVNTACNACRARKTRCDGERPACSYCRTTGAQCVYRQNGSEQVLINEQVILERLERIESRLDSSNHSNASIPSTDTDTTHATHFGSPWTCCHPGPVPDILGINTADNKMLQNTQTPLFHTASSHKMLHYWPRINMSVTLDNINPLKYVEDTESRGVPPSLHKIEADMDYDVVRYYLNKVTDNSNGINYLLCQLLQRHSDVFSAFETAPSLVSPISSHGDARRLRLQDLSCPMLLTINLAARCVRGRPGGRSVDEVAQELKDRSFRGVCAKVGDLIFMPDDDSIPFLILGAHILMSDAYPIGALKLIQTAGDRLSRCSRRQVNEEWWKDKLQVCLKLHHIIESDILLTMDGLPSELAFLALNQLSEVKTLKEVETGYLNLSVAEIARKKMTESLFEATFTLCNLQNRILSQLYTIEQAYSQPSVLASSVAELKAELCHWFDSLPLEWHFPRDLSGAMSIPSPALDILVHLRMRYYVLEFIMCRPILYYVAHESVENPAEHRESPQGHNAGHEARPFWVYDACHRCLQCAALIILGNETDTSRIKTRQRDWFEVHLIWGAALTLILSLTTPILTNFLPKYGNVIDSYVLVARAEEILELDGSPSGVVLRCLNILRNVKANLLGVSSPMDESPSTPLIA